jgi:ankyrin repeat protein
LGEYFQFESTIMNIYNNTTGTNVFTKQNVKTNGKKNGKNIQFNTSNITFIEAIRRCDLELVKNFIRKGSNLNPTSDEKWYKIYYTLKNLNNQNHLEMFDFLIENGINVNRTNFLDGRTILFDAVSQDNIRLVEFLLTKGANINQIDMRGHSPLHEALCSHRLMTINKIYADMIKILIKHGANVNLKNKYGVSPFHAIVHFKDISLIEYFIENGADLNSIHEHSGKTPLYLALGLIDNISIIELLINKGADVNDIWDIDDNMMYSISYAFNMNKTQYIPILLAAGADDPDIRIKISKDDVFVGNGAAIGIPKKEIELAGFNAIRKRAGTICIALQDLDLPAPQTIEIIVHACVPFAENLPYHYLWDLVVMVKHFHDRQRKLLVK